MRILVIEDERPLSEQIVTELRNNGFTPDQAFDGLDGLYYAQEYSYDLMVIDLGLPKRSGSEIIEELRNDGNKTPIIILTARDHWQDKVDGLTSGADDYLTKPFHMPELMARINALLRRTAGQAKSIFTLGPLSLDTNKQIISISEETVDITAYEYKIMEYLLYNPDKVISKTELTEHIYEQDYDRDSNVIEVLIGRLRKKLDPANELKPIETLRGRGYRINSSWTD